MTNTQEFIDKLKTLKKSYFTLADLKKFYPSKASNLPVVVNRLVKQGRLIRLCKNFYTINLSSVKWEALAIELVSPSYLSFEYALWQHGLINEIPTSLTLATTKKSRQFKLPNNILEYSHLNKKLFFGYILVDDYYSALPEKAYLDELYLISLKKRSFNLKAIETGKLNKKRLKQWSKKYPIYTQRLVRQLIKI